MSHRTQCEYYDDDLLDDVDLFDEAHSDNENSDDAPQDLFDDDPPDEERPEDHNEDKYDDHNDYDYNDDHLFRCKARYRGHIPCMQIFSCEHDIGEHLRVTHKTRKWLVETYVRIT